MSTSPEPKRSFEDPQLPQALRIALSAARADGPSAESLARVAARLSAASSGTSGVQVAGASTGRSKLLAIAVLCLLGGAGLHAALTSAPVETVSVAAVSELPAASPETNTLAAPTPAPVYVPEVVVEDALISEPSAARSKAPLADKSRDQNTSRVQAKPIDPNAELELLRRAQAALTPAPSRALALCEEHVQRFPRGAFQQERELIAVVALANRGELQAAHARADRFKRAYPESVHTQRLETLLRGHKRDALDAPIGKPAASRPTSGE